MLVLSRKPGESIKLGEDIEVIIIGVEGHRVRIGVNAPREVRIMRAEVDPSVIQSNKQAVLNDEKSASQLLKQAASAHQKQSLDNQRKT